MAYDLYKFIIFSDKFEQSKIKPYSENTTKAHT